MVGARLEDREALARAPFLQVVAGADAGDAGADDQDVYMLWRHIPEADCTGPARWRRLTSVTRRVTDINER